MSPKKKSSKKKKPRKPRARKPRTPVIVEDYDDYESYGRDQLIERVNLSRGPMVSEWQRVNDDDDRYGYEIQQPTIQYRQPASPYARLGSIRSNFGPDVTQLRAIQAAQQAKLAEKKVAPTLLASNPPLSPADRKTESESKIQDWLAQREARERERLATKERADEARMAMQRQQREAYLKGVEERANERQRQQQIQREADAKRAETELLRQTQQRIQRENELKLAESQQRERQQQLERQRALDVKQSPSPLTIAPLAPIDKIDQIQGPTSIAHLYNPATQLQIYVMSDIHEKIAGEDCQTGRFIEVADFFKYLANANKQKILDFYLEIAYTPKEQKESLEYEGGYLFGDTFAKLKGCIQRDKTSCQIKNARFHSIDVRSIAPLAVNTFSNASRFFYDMVNEASDKKNRWDFISYALSRKGKTDGRSFYDVIYSLEPTFPKSLHITNLVKMTRIGKQFERMSPQLVNAITNYFGLGSNQRTFTPYSAIKENVQRLQQLLATVSRDSPPTDEVKIQLNQVTDRFFNVMVEYRANLAALMDAYTIARMLKPAGNVLDQPKYAVIFAGAAHTNPMIGFLQSHGFTLLEVAKPNRVQCMDVKRFKQPFFSAM